MKRLRTAFVPLLAPAVAVAVLSAAGCGGGDPAAPAVEDVPTTVFGRQARELAVGIATERRRDRVAVATTVLGQDGTRRRGLKVDVAPANGGWRRARPCGAGRYCGTVQVAGARPVVRIRLARPNARSSTVSVRLPRNARPERAAELVRSSSAALRRLHSLIVNERLEAGPGSPALVTQFTYVAPDRLSYRITDGGSSVVIGGHRWDRRGPNDRWEESTQEPVRVPAPDWRRVRDPSLLGTTTSDGRRVDTVSFFDPTVPAWFEAEIDRQTSLPLRVRMIAAAHFMTHTLGAFNAPLAILPPTR